MIITISGIPGAGSTTAARGIAEKLGYDILTVGEIYKKYAEKQGISRAEIHKLWEIHAKNPEEEEEFHKALDEEVKNVCRQKKDIVLNGKLAAFQIPNADFKILLIAPLEVRARRSAARDKIPAMDAKKSIEEREMYERMEWKRIYGFDYAREIEAYDMILNTGNFDSEQTIEMIHHALKLKKKIQVI